MSGKQLALSSRGLVARKGGSASHSDDGKDALEHALASFQSVLNDDERIRLQQTKGSSCNAGSIIQFTHELDNLDAGRRGKSMATTLYSLFQTVEQFYQIADTYVSSHPEIAALVWGSVKLAFMVLGNFTSYFQKFSELLRGFDQLMPYFTEYRRLFPGSMRLRRATYEFQATVIDCCAEIVTATRRPWQKKFLASLSQSFQSEMQPFVNKIREKAKQVKEEIKLAKAQADHQHQTLQSAELRQAKKSRRDISRWFARSEQEVQGLRQDELARATEHEWYTLLDRLSSYDHTAAFKIARDKRHNGTAEWIFRTKDFQDWYIGQHSGILHLVGMIGSGKTVLTANVVDYLIRQRGQNSQAVVFYFVRFDDKASQLSEHIIRSMIRQLFSHESPNPELLQLLQVSNRGLFSNESLIRLWHEGAKSYEDVFLVLDGFDECTLVERRVILKTISRLTIACEGLVKIKTLLSSRESVMQEIDRIHLALFRVNLDVINITSDLRKYATEILDDKISTEELVIQDKNLIAEILQAISRGGEGMFLWVFLSIEDICSRTSDSEIREALRSIPWKLSETFDRALQRIEKNNKTETAQMIFNWTATVLSPLNLDQLKEALAVEIGQEYSDPDRYLNRIERITSWCENLVRIEETDETVHFSHHSIQSYLLDASNKFRINRLRWDHHVGEVCVTYLNFNDFKTALIETPETQSITLDDYPQAITKAAIRNAVPGLSGERVIDSAWKWFRRSKPLSLTSKGQEPDEVPFDSAFALDHPFFQYAFTQWLPHTISFSPNNSKTWYLWKSMIWNDQTPWLVADWLPLENVEFDEQKWISSTKFTDFGRYKKQVVAMHKAIVLAGSIGHYRLMNEIFRKDRIPGNHVIPLNPWLLESFFPLHKPFYDLGWPFQYNSEDRTPHDEVVDLFTRFMARDHLWWPTMTRSPAYDSCIRFESPGADYDYRTSQKSWLTKHGLGLHQDVVAAMQGRPVTPWMRLFAKITTLNLDASLKAEIEAKLDVAIIQARAAPNKTIINLILEKEENCSRATIDWISNLALSRIGQHNSDAVNCMARETMQHALQSGNQTMIAALLRVRYTDWMRHGKIDHRTIKYAVEFKGMPNALRKKFIDRFLDVDTILRYDSDKGTQTVHITSPPPPRILVDERDKSEKSVRNDALAHAVDETSWQFAVALYGIGARLYASKSSKPKCPRHHEHLNDTLRCLVRGQARTAVDYGLNFCVLEDASSDGQVEIRFCGNHVGLCPHN